MENLGQHLTSWSKTVFFRSNIELSGSFYSQVQSKIKDILWFTKSIDGKFEFMPPQNYEH